MEWLVATLILSVVKSITTFCFAMVSFWERGFDECSRKVKKEKNERIWNHFYGFGPSWWLFGGGVGGLESQ